MGWAYSSITSAFLSQAPELLHQWLMFDPHPLTRWCITWILLTWRIMFIYIWLILLLRTLLLKIQIKSSRFETIILYLSLLKLNGFPLEIYFRVISPHLMLLLLGKMWHLPLPLFQTTSLRMGSRCRWRTTSSSTWPRTPSTLAASATLFLQTTPASSGAGEAGTSRLLGSAGGSWQSPTVSQLKASSYGKKMHFRPGVKNI